MKKKVPKQLEKCRIITGPLRSDKSFGLNGFFQIKYKRFVLSVMASNHLGWDHVSVSLPDRIPSWREMCFVKDLFFDEEETVIQYHPPKSKYINYYPNVLHLWRKQNHDYELPPSFMIA